MALNSLSCADVPLSNYSLTHLIILIYWRFVQTSTNYLQTCHSTWWNRKLQCNSALFWSRGTKTVTSLVKKQSNAVVNFRFIWHIEQTNTIEYLNI